MMEAVPPPPYPDLLVGDVGRYERWDPDRHTDAFVGLCGDAEVMRFLGGPMTRAVAADISERIADHWDTFGYGLWAAIALDGDRIAGFTGACRAAWHPHFARDTEVGWRLARWAWGLGLATEGARLAIEPARPRATRAELLAFVHPANARWRAVVKRLGMLVIGQTRDPRLRHPLDVFALPVA